MAVASLAALLSVVPTGGVAAQTNTAPVFADDTVTLSLAENTDSGYSPDTKRDVGSAITATDADGDELAYSLTGDDDDEIFEIGSASGQLTTKDTYFDYESSGRRPHRDHWTEPSDNETGSPRFKAGAGPYTVTVTAKDTSGATDTVEVVINVTDVTETPTPQICDNSSGTPDTVCRPPTPLVGGPMIAHVADYPGEQSEITWRWYRRRSHPIEEVGTTASFTPTDALLGRGLSIAAWWGDDLDIERYVDDPLSGVRVGCRSGTTISSEVSNLVMIRLGLSDAGRSATTADMLEITHLSATRLGNVSFETTQGLQSSSGLANTTGLQCAVNMEDLRLKNNSLSSIDVSNMRDLETLILTGNSFTSIDLSNNSELKYLDVSDNALTSLDVSNLAELDVLKANSNNLTSVSTFMGNNQKVRSIHLADNPKDPSDRTSSGITTIDARNIDTLLFVYAGDNGLTSLNLTGADNVILVDLADDHIKTGISTSYTTTALTEAISEKITGLRTLCPMSTTTIGGTTRFTGWDRVGNTGCAAVLLIPAHRSAGALPYTMENAGEVTVGADRVPYLVSVPSAPVGGL